MTRNQLSAQHPLLTPQGARHLQRELDRLRQAERPDVIESLADARDQRTLQRRPEYLDAVERQGKIERRIRHLEHLLAKARVSSEAETAADNRVDFGAHITLLDDESAAELRLRLVDSDDAEIDEPQQLSGYSPLGRALLGKEVGSLIKLRNPSGAKHYRIVAVDYA